MRTGFPPRVSSYRLTSKTNCPNWTISEGMEAPCDASYGHSTILRLVTYPTDNLQALSIVCCMAQWQYMGSNPGEAERHLINFGGNMKFRISHILVVMVLAASSEVAAHARECADSTIKGTYAFTIHGQILTPGGPLVVDGIAKTTFHGGRELTQVSAVAIDGVIPLIWSPSTGTYTVNSDCTGTMTLISTGQPALHLAILISQSGSHIHTVVTDPGFATTSDAERVWVNDDLD
jgi:hypothetical protein